MKDECNAMDWRRWHNRRIIIEDLLSFFLLFSPECRLRPCRHGAFILDLDAKAQLQMGPGSH
jgi:hypothetical protein